MFIALLYHVEDVSFTLIVLANITTFRLKKGDEIKSRLLSI